MQKGSVKKFIIFDFDDTLTDNSLRDFHSFEALIDNFDIQKFSRNKIFSLRRNNYSSNEICKILCKNNESILDDLKKSREYFLNDYNSYSKYVKLKPGTKKILKKLNLDGHVLFLNSIQSNRKSFIETLKDLELLTYFQDVYTTKMLLNKSNSDQRIKLKKNMYSRIISDHKILKNNSNTFVVGNLFSDLIPAKFFHLNTLLIRGSYGFDSEKLYNSKQILSLGKIKKITSLDQILKIIS